MQVWEKAAADNARGRFLESNPLSPIRLLPADLMVETILPRLKHSLADDLSWDDVWIRHLAVNLVYDLMGKPG